MADSVKPGPAACMLGYMVVPQAVHIDTESIKDIYSHHPRHAACLQYSFLHCKKADRCNHACRMAHHPGLEIYMARNIVDRIRRGCAAAVVLKSIVFSQCHLHSQFTLVLAGKSIRRTWARRCHPSCIKSPYQRCPASFAIAACTLPYCFRKGRCTYRRNTHK